MEAVFHAHSVVVGQAVVCDIVVVVDPSREFADFVILGFLHLPEGDCLSGLTH